ncbi:Putative esterase [Cyclonatronum proteinivorum]|uniref:Esterase n=1 Tax=Cyclonatronum proteinivorum TaxID=1457365 RepID=A0A345UPG9_9BACT|nr:alpha/beta hydrolase-fold protein [Cyclonatronum proteinivorum]AXJ02371.1 Putative esterase [Cyclonatronum proteinivorum]
MITPLHRNILARHKGTLSGALRVLPFRSRALGVSRTVFVYEPPNMRNVSDMHLLYLFRGHEREFVYINEDDSRETTTIEDLDALIVSGEIPPVMAVIPGLTSLDGKKHSMGINTLVPPQDMRDGLGTGQVWDFLTLDLIPYLEARYQKKLGSGIRMAAGFSLGGYTAALLATAFPGYLDHAGIYDGLFMFDGQTDIRTNAPDEIWLKSAVPDAALCPAEKRSPENLAPWNPAELIRYADPVTLEEIQETMFWIRSAAGDGQEGNHDRCKYFTALLREHGITAGFNRIPLHPDARHTWHWNDRFIRLFLLNVFSV